MLQNHKCLKTKHKNIRSHNFVYLILHNFALKNYSQTCLFNSEIKSVNLNLFADYIKQRLEDLEKEKFY